MRLYTTLSVILCSFLFFSCKDSEDTSALPPRGEWKRLNDFPGEGRNEALSFVVGDKGYIALGLTSTAFISEVWEYDPEKDAWNQKKDFPYEAFGGTALGLGDKGYMMVYPKTLYSYDPQRDAWEQMPRLPDNARSFITAFAIDGKGYFGTDTNPDGAQNDLWLFDPVTNGWTLKAVFAGEPNEHPSSFSIGQKGYMGMGISTSNEVLASLYEYDPASNRWSKKQDGTRLPAIEAFTFSSASAGYVALSLDGINQAPFYKYDPQTDRWITDAPSPTGDCLRSMAFTIGSRIFVMTGKKEVWEFIP